MRKVYLKLIESQREDNYGDKKTDYSDVGRLLRRSLDKARDRFTSQ